MPCIERTGKLGVIAATLLVACSAPPPAPAPAPPPVRPAPSAPPVAPAAADAGLPRLGPPGAVRNWAEVRSQAARRMMVANPTLTYSGAVPDPLLAIPVLEIELNADGSVRRIDVLRYPTQARDTVQLAMDAVRRAAPYGDVSRLPKPWRFVETFLFNDERKFKPRTLDS